MALRWQEDRASRSATIVRLGRKASSSHSRSYKVFGTTDDLELHAEANARISSSLAYWQYPGKPDVQLRAESYSVSYLGDDAWQVTISYEKNGADDDTQVDPLKRSRSFDTTGGTQHITQALAETAYSQSFLLPAPDQQKAIGVDGNGVNGVDIIVPALQWQEQYDVPSSYVTTAYIRSLASITGTTNNADFRGFSAGEVLFAGCSGNQEWDDQRGNGPWSLSFRFIASPNAGTGGSIPALTIGGISGINKKGHEYLWVRYEETVSSSTLLKTPKHVYVDRVYREGNFSTLGIGVS